MPRIQVQNVTKRFGDIVALEKVDLEVQDGEYVAILGPSGCGKTSLIKIIAGMWQPTEGRVLVGGRDVTETPVEDRDLGYVFQNIVLFPHMNVKENVGYGPRVKGSGTSEIGAASHEALELVKMLEQQGLFPRELSGGAQQKASLARALANRASLLLLDEPLSALDARVRVELRYTLRRLVKDLKLTAIHVTHDQEEALSVADRVVLMRKGSIVEMGKPEQIYERPQNLFTANFVGESNFFEGTVHHVDDGVATVELRGRQFLRMPRVRVGPGQPVVIAVRPEHLAVRVESGPNCLQGVLEESRFMGSFIRYRFRLTSGDYAFVDLLPRETRLESGDVASISFDPESLLVYPRPSEGLAEVLRLE
jgi:ABC-type Fe3+/spermidine/putrescine transport system ATPase subunit